MLNRESGVREDNWSEAIAVGNLNSVGKVESELDTYALREDGETYGPN